jgi:predicted RNA-binding Zn-ribbon protein involved in translation (DUF1610 family)
MNFETEGDWKCPKCGGLEFYKTRKEVVVGAARVTQYQDVRMCAKCDIEMASASAAKIQDASSGCVSTLAILAFSGFALYWLIQIFI